ncbi:sigma 54-interacting transcriptional regulator [Tumebacillus permanentifrigoris]|uniref:HTH-type transcriptional regulatory protein TyrR n=1 Tax=Tumebacillus permanentifrigoris TaxID=378543 RepID=A0A316DD77_9BACL|nr:sigma 54-interacting transcriptional regulator [Tumebacillus permanentifrigoris]PWK15954.1 transcriptional regulator of aroF, aroG, tyrA and aromatic amino acid transport [Tumebacillus permanentifrigoris]
MSMIRWMVETTDRIGMTLDVVRVLTDHACNIEAMEVMRHFVYVRFEHPQNEVERVQRDLLHIDGVQAVTKVQKLPAEERESQWVRESFKSRADEITFDDIVHESDLMRRCIQTARMVAKTDSTVLLLGESGTGKELFARAIHNASSRMQYTFVAINCAALPEHLLESELFGYEEGAFTGTKKGGKPGLYEAADKGTLFLDEIAELPLPLQAKLLRTIQAGTFRRVGGTREQQVNVRVIAATNRDLQQMVRKGQFREDLYYRLHVIPVQIPPLRSRPEDVVLLAEHFLQNWRQKTGKMGLVLSAACQERMSQYDFPGNVRELENMVERSVHLVDGECIEPYHMMFPEERPSAQRGLGTGSLKERVEEFERQVLADFLDRYDSLRTVAKQLGTSHTTIINKAHRYGLVRGREEERE